MMRKILALLGTAVFSCGVASALDIVTPVGKYNKTLHDSVYFIGSLDKGETLYYQGEKVKPASNGAFAFTVPLKQGRNQVFLRACKDGRCTVKQYYITKELSPVSKAETAAFVPIGRSLFKTTDNLVPLRYTPIDAGMNRMGHLSKNTNLIVDGRQGDFYRVYLTPTRFGWVHKKDVSLAYDIKGFPEKPVLAKFYNVDDKTVPDLSMYRVAFSNNLPYEVVDNSDELLINIFNVANMNDETLTLRVSKNELIKYSTSFNNGDFTLILKNITKPATKSLRGVNIIVDAGHGGQEKGAIGIFRDEEKNINLAVAQSLREKLELQGATVYMTRNTDQDVPLQDRVKLAKAYDADLFVSIHLNSVPQGTDPLAKQGTSVYYYNNSAKQLATSIKDSLVKNINTKDDGVHQASFAVLRSGEYLGVLAELCYLVNPEDSVIYKSDKFALEAADAISAGIVNYMSAKSDVKSKQMVVTPPDVSKKNFVKQKKTSLKPQKTAAEKGLKIKKVKHKNVVKKKKETKVVKPFFDTSIRQKYEQEAIYIIDKDDTKWYRPRGKKKRVKRPPRVIKNEITPGSESVNIFASGDYDEPVMQEKQTFSERTKTFFSKLGSYLYNGAKN